MVIKHGLQGKRYLRGGFNEITGKSSSLGKSACIMYKRCPIPKDSLCSIALTVTGCKC